MVAGAKKIALMCLGLAVQKFGQELDRPAGGARPLRRHRHGDLRPGERPCCARRSARPREGEDKAALQEAAVRCFAQDAMDRIEVVGPPPAGRGRRGRHAAHLPGRPAPLHQARGRGHRGPAPPGRRRRDRGGRISVLASHHGDTASALPCLRGHDVPSGRSPVGKASPATRSRKVEWRAWSESRAAAKSARPCSITRAGSFATQGAFQ